MSRGSNMIVLQLCCFDLEDKKNKLVVKQEKNVEATTGGGGPSRWGLLRSRKAAWKLSVRMLVNA